MSNNGFVTNFMRFAQATTRAERSMALGLDKSVHDSVNVDASLLEEDEFSRLLHTAVDEAIDSDTVVITNNMVQELQDAPNTNLHLHELRMIIAIPLRGYGAVYLDQRIRNGVFPRELIEKLNDFARYVVENEKTDLSASDYNELFQGVKND